MNKEYGFEAHLLSHDYGSSQPILSSQVGWVSAIKQ